MTVHPSFFSVLSDYLASRTAEFIQIDSDRKAILESTSHYIQGKLAKSEPVKLIFICTHNSRRSHLTQIWAQVAADFYGLKGIATFSGGTEATAFNPRAVAALRRAGLKIIADDPLAKNPKYSVYTSDALVPQVCFSKVYDESPNPKSGYCAVMTCSQADEACPLIVGCDLRVPIRYDDPKSADDTPLETQRYDERCRQVCTEMLYLMSHV